MSELPRGNTTTPALFSVGFRPFFLFGSAYTALSMFLWLPYFQGELELLTRFSGVDWHIHEWLFGYVPAVITGFLLTAVPNWTGRLPIKGFALAILVLIWISGRLAITFSDYVSWPVTAIIDCSFLISVALLIAREIIAGRNWRNLKVLIPISILALANVSFHIESTFQGSTNISGRFGLSAVIILIMLIGGRIIPSFTRNWLVRENPGKLPKPFARYDLYAIAVSGIALASWIIAPDIQLTGILLLISSIAQFVRMSRWAGYRTIREPLVFILHIGYLFIPIGLLLLGLSAFIPEIIVPAAGIHALGVGAIGSMTLSVMLRASLGHTGRELKASFFSIIILLAIIVAAGARILQAVSFGDYEIMLHISGAAWILAFGGFAISFGPALLRPRT